MLYYSCKEVMVLVFKKGGESVADKTPDREKLHQLIRDIAVGVISGIIANLICELVKFFI